MSIRQVVFPDGGNRPLVFYLAAEEYVSRHLDTLLGDVPAGGREALFIWQVEPTVIFGRNQVMEAEVNMDYCREHGVRLFRRKSGGGCVYADMGNIMVSYITDHTDVEGVFGLYLDRLAAFLRSLGLDASKSGRNDVLVGGRKVSGNAFFRQQRSSIVHGTMLFDSDFAALEAAITPSAAKISSKGVSSVRSHVTNLKQELLSVGNVKYSDIEVFKSSMLEYFCSGGEIRLGPDEMSAIGQIEHGYHDPDFISGRRKACKMEFRGKIPQSGEISVCMDLEGGKIGSVSLQGDFFELFPGAAARLEDGMTGLEFERGTVMSALENLSPEKLVMNLSAGDLCNILFKQ